MLPEALAGVGGVYLLYYMVKRAFGAGAVLKMEELHKAFYDKLDNKDMLLQASSYSPYSWHILARSASADGHGDLKGYLDERSGGFDFLARDGMPLDIGWYYGYDPTSTPDQYEYILGTTIGYDSSMSFQVSCAAAASPVVSIIAATGTRYLRKRLAGVSPKNIL